MERITGCLYGVRLNERSHDLHRVKPGAYKGRYYNEVELYKAERGDETKEEPNL